MALIDKLSAIGNAIREKTGKEELLTLEQMPEEIASITTGGSEEDFIGVKYSNFSIANNAYYLPRTADARSLDKALENPSEVSTNVNSAVNGTILSSKFSNSSKVAGGGYHYNLEEVYLPSKATVLSGTFTNCARLKTIHGDLSNITQLNTTFGSCTSLDINALLLRLTKLQSIGNNSFQNCTQITEITLPATLTSISGGAFKGCTNLKDIYVPWAEGEVTNAPWGATNATIHYNWTGEEVTNA